MTEEEKVIEVPWDMVFKFASGVDSEYNPCSAGNLAVHKIINEKEIKKCKEIFLQDAVLNFYVSGGAATITLDFKKPSFGTYDAVYTTCRNWLDHIEEDDYTKQLTLTVIPYVFDGQIILLFDQLVFADCYKMSEGSEDIFRIILTFDNENTKVVTTDKINYQEIYHKIQLELTRYEQEIEDDINQAIEEEREAKEQENLIDAQITTELNHPLEMMNRNRRNKDESVLEAEEEERIRFVEEDETIR